MPPTVVIVGGRYADHAIELAELERVGALLRSGPGGTPEEIVESAHGADVILAGSGPRFTDEVLQQLPACRGIVRYGVGTDTIDIPAAQRLGIQVGNVPDYGTDAVSLHAVTLALAGIRRLVEADRRVRSGVWQYAELKPLHLPAVLRAGVVGLGRIGMRTAQLLSGLGFEVYGFDAFAPLDAPRDGVHPASLEEVLERSDVLTIHVPATSDGGPLLGAEEFARMREGSVLVNTARGALVDEAALVAGLRAHRPRIAALDVFAQEPPDLSVFDDVADRVIFSPHMAWYTEETEEDLRRKAAQEAARLVEGAALHYPVSSGA